MLAGKLERANTCTCTHVYTRTFTCTYVCRSAGACMVLHATMRIHQNLDTSTSVYVHVRVRPHEGVKRGGPHVRGSSRRFLSTPGHRFLKRTIIQTPCKGARISRVYRIYRWVIGIPIRGILGVCSSNPCGRSSLLFILREEHKLQKFKILG